MSPAELRVWLENMFSHLDVGGLQLGPDCWFVLDSQTKMTYWPNDLHGDLADHECYEWHQRNVI